MESTSRGTGVVTVSGPISHSMTSGSQMCAFRANSRRLWAYSPTRSKATLIAMINQSSQFIQTLSLAKSTRSLEIADGELPIQSWSTAQRTLRKEGALIDGTWNTWIQKCQVILQVTLRVSQTSSLKRCFSTWVLNNTILTTHPSPRSLWVA